MLGPSRWVFSVITHGFGCDNLLTDNKGRYGEIGKGDYGEIRLATQTPNQRTRTSAIDIENTFEGQKSKGLPSRGAGADKPTQKRENV